MSDVILSFVGCQSEWAVEDVTLDLLVGAKDAVSRRPSS